MTRARARWAVASDLPALTRFFRKAYGPETVFGDDRFIRWYFGSEGGSDRLLSIIAPDPSGEVLAHYGGVKCEITLDGDPVPLVWGVNAFTLPEYRGEGIGGELVKFLMERCEVFGVIGFTPKTADFYARSGFHLFDKKRFQRFVVPLSPAVITMAEKIGSDVSRLASLLSSPGPQVDDTSRTWPNIEKLRTASPPFQLVHNQRARITIRRSQEFLRWRFFTFPAPEYEIYSAPGDPACTAWLVVRREQLFTEPPLWMTRIVDIWGREDSLESLIGGLVASSRERGDACIECGLFGDGYGDLLRRRGFTCLDGDDAALLPQVTAPPEARPNHEYLGLFSERWNSRIQQVGWENVHFTRMASDRDRLARVSQISQRVEGCR